MAPRSYYHPALFAAAFTFAALISSTQAQSATPAPPAPSSLKISVTAGGCLNFWEIMAFTPDGRNAAWNRAPGVQQAVSTMYNSFPHSSAVYANDLIALTYYNVPNQFIDSNCATPGDFWAVYFPQPTLISTVYFFNRQDGVGTGGNAARIVSAAGVISLLNAANATTESQSIGSPNGVTTLTFTAPTTWPTYPNLAIPSVAATQAAMAGSWVRYVKFIGAVGQFINLKELQVFDDQGYNVVLGKSITCTSVYSSSFPCTNVNNGVIQMDTDPGDMYHSLQSATAGDTYVLIDLGGMYHVTAVVVYNRIGCTVTTSLSICTTNLLGRMTGASIAFLNAASATLTTVSISTGTAIMTYNVTLPTPTPTPSNTPSSTKTPPVTPSSTAALSVGAAPSNTPTPSGTPTPTGTPTVTPFAPYPNRMFIASQNGNCLNFIEVFVFTSTGQNVAASAIGGVATLSTTYGSNYAYYGNDMYADPPTAVSNNWFVNGGCASGGDVWRLSFPPATGYPSGLPVPISSVVFVNRQDSTGNAVRITAGLGYLQLVDPNGTMTAQRTFTSAQTVSVFTFNDAQTAAIYPSNTAFQSAELNKRKFVRYVTITSVPLQCLYFRELYVFDTTYTNVALFKPVTGSAPWFVDPATGSNSTLSMGNDGVIDMDNAAGNMANFPCDGSGWWRVDLGGVYNLSSLVFFNRYPGVYGVGGSGFGLTALGAQVTYSNYYGDYIGGATLTGNMIQTVAVVTVPPTPSITATPSSTSTPSNSDTASGSASESTTGTGSPSVTPSNTASPSASISSGAVPSGTASPSFSISVSGTSSLTLSGTPSYTTTSSPTASVTATTLSLLPGKARITTTGGFYGTLRFFELFVFSPTMQLLSASVNGGVASSSSVYQSIPFLYGPAFGNDMLADVSVNETGLVECAGAAAGDWWEVAWPTGSHVSLIYFVNRGTNNGANFNQQITNGTGTVTVYSQAGAPLASAQLTSATVTTVASGVLGPAGVVAQGLSPPVGPGYPDPADPWQASFAAQKYAVRYINLTASPNNFLHFRELFVFDSTWTNVALNKPVTATPQYLGDPTLYLASMGNNGIIDYDSSSGDLTHSLSGTGNAWWAVDLGGMYNVTRFVMFNRDPVAVLGLRMQGATMTFYNAFHEIVFIQTMAASAIQTYNVVVYPPTPSITSTASITATTSITATYTPTRSATTSITASSSATGSPTATSSASLTIGVSASSTWTPTTTPTSTPTPSGTPVSANPQKVRIATSGTGQCLNFMELFIFDVNGRNVGATAAGAALSLTTTYSPNYAYYGGDFLADPYVYDPLQIFVNAGCSATSDYYQAIFPPGPAFAAGMPAPVSQIVFVNRMNGENTRITTGAGQVQLFSINGSVIAWQPITNTGTVSVFNYTTWGQSNAPLAPNPASPSQTDATARTLGVRYVRIVAGVNQYLHFRELYVFDNTSTNVALLKSTSASSQFTSDPAVYTASMGVDGNVVDFDAQYGNMVQCAPSATAGAAWWQVDLGGVYPNITKIVLWNRYYASNAAIATRMASNTMYLLNYYGDVVGSAALNGNAIQTLSIATYPPSPSLTSTPSPSVSSSLSMTAAPSVSASPTASLTISQSASITASASSTGSLTSSSSASISLGVSISNTGSTTASSSDTGSATASSTQSSTSTATASLTRTPTSTSTSSGTPTPSPSLTTSPISTNPVRVRLSTSGTGQCLNFIELFVFDVNGRDVGASVAGAALSQSTVYGSNFASYGGDLQCDAWGNFGTQTFVNDGCTAASDYYQAIFPPSPPLYPNGLPAPIASVVFVNRLDGGNNQRIVSSNGVVQLFNPFGAMTASRPITSNASITVLTFGISNAPVYPNPASPFQTSAANRLLLPRYVKLIAAPGQCLAFREVFVFDSTYTNVALLKSSTSSSLVTSDPTAYSPAMGVDGVIDMDNVASGNMVLSSACNGAGWWQVDLGGVYQLTSVIVFNRFPFVSASNTGSTLGAKLSGATLQYLNYNGDVIGNATLNGNQIQTVTVATYPSTPSATPTSTLSATRTPSNTPSASLSATSSVSATSSLTATSSASISFGTTPSATSSPTVSATATASSTSSSTDTPSASATITATPSGTASTTSTPTSTASQLSYYPVKARVATSGAGQCLSFVELFVFSTRGQDVGAAAAGATLSLSSSAASGGYGAAFGGDLSADPWAAGTSGTYVSSACNGTSDYYQAIFPPLLPQYPGGLPVPIATAYFVNRIDSSVASKIVSSNGAVQLYSQNGTLAFSKPISSALSVSTLSFGPALSVSSPNPADPVQTDPAARTAYARYVRIAAAAASCLYFRELFVFDNTYTNVAYSKSTSSSGQYSLDSVAYTSAMGVNGVIDMDTVGPSDMTYTAQCDGSGWWQVDLGGVYNLTKVVLFNRYPFTVPQANGQAIGSQMAGATMQFLNYYGSVIGSQTLTGGMVQTYAVSTYAPSPTSSSSATTTGTATPSHSPPITHTQSRSGSLTASDTATPTPTTSNTPTWSSSSTPTPTPSVSASATNTASVSATASVSTTPSSSGSAALSASRTRSRTATATRSESSTGSATASSSPSSSGTATPAATSPPSTVSSTMSSSASGSGSASTTGSASVTAAASVTSARTVTRSATRSRSGTVTPTPTRSNSGSSSVSATGSSSGTSTGTSASTVTGTPTLSPTASPVPTSPASTPSPIPSSPAATGSRTPTIATGTPSLSPPASGTSAPSTTRTGTPTRTPTKTRTATGTPTRSPTKTRTSTNSPTRTKTATRSRSATKKK